MRPPPACLSPAGSHSKQHVKPPPASRTRVWLRRVYRSTSAGREHDWRSVQHFRWACGGELSPATVSYTLTPNPNGTLSGERTAAVDGPGCGTPASPRRLRVAGHGGSGMNSARRQAYPGVKQRWQFGSTATSRIADSPVNHFMPERCSPINRPNSARDRIPSFR